MHCLHCLSHNMSNSCNYYNLPLKREFTSLEGDLFQLQFDSASFSSTSSMFTFILSIRPVRLWLVAQQNPGSALDLAAFQDLRANKCLAKLFSNCDLWRMPQQASYVNWPLIWKRAKCCQIVWCATVDNAYTIPGAKLMAHSPIRPRLCTVSCASPGGVNKSLGAQSVSIVWIATNGTH